MKPTSPAPVHYRVAPGGGLLFALAVWQLVLGGGLIAWVLALRQAQQTGVAAIGLVMAIAYGGGCWLSWRAMRTLPKGWLVWTGKAWRLQQTSEDSAESSGASGAVAEYPCCTMALDMQQAVLLRLHGSQAKGRHGRPFAPACWVWASRRSDRASDSTNWHALRSALVWAHAGHAAVGEGTDGARAPAKTGAVSATPQQPGAAS